jgi:glycosyltransferase involved in cell wall biosynthesis
MTTKYPNHNIVAIIPCYNTACHIGEVVKKTLPHVDKVIVVDDGSKDATAQLAGEAGATVVSHENNKGYGGAIKTCFKTARDVGATILITIDGDGQHNPEEITNLTRPILENRADIVIGSRFLTRKHQIPDYRRFGIKVITWLYNFGSKAKVSDSQSGFRAYSSDVITKLSLRENGMSNSVEILVNARRQNFRFAEAPITCSYDHQNINKGAVKHGLGVALSVIKMRIKKA